jgi:hydroxymethylpyrimidine/phosphomethylpyrimidine kinase
MRPRVLVLSHVDPTGLHGMAPDIRAIDAMGAKPLPVATGITIGNPSAPERLDPVPLRALRRMLDAALDEEPLAAVVGLVPRRRHLRVIASGLAEFGPPTIVFAPLHLEFDARPLLGRGTLVAAVRELLPEATAVVLPALFSSGIVNLADHSLSSVKAAGQQLLQTGARSAWLRAASHEGRSIDVFTDATGAGLLDYPKPNPEAEPSSAAAALAGQLAVGTALRLAVDRAHRYACALDRAPHRVLG